MTKDERLRYEMFQRVRDFGTAHRQHFPDDSMGGKAFRAVEAAIAEIEARATEKVLTAEEGKTSRTAAREALLERLAVIARTARLVSKSAPGADAVFQMPEYRSDVDLLTAARACVREAQAGLDRFVLLGMPKTFVTDLQALVDAFEQAVHGRRVGRAGAAAARAGLKAALVQGLDAVRTLDIVVTNTLGDDAASLAVWKRDRKLYPKAKPIAAAENAPPPSPPVTPPEPAGPARALAPPAAAPAVETPDAIAPDSLERRAS